MLVTSYNFRKIQWKDLEKSSKMFILDPQMPHFYPILDRADFKNTLTGRKLLIKIMVKKW